MNSTEQLKFGQLLAALGDQELSIAQSRRLDEMLRADEDARRKYHEYIEIHTMLEWMSSSVQAGDSQLPSTSHAVEPIELANPRWHRRAWTSVYDFASNYIVLSALVSTIFLTILLLSMALIVPDWKRFVPGPTPPDIEFVAKITDTHDANWDESSDGNFNNIDLFAGERLVLNEGLAEVTFADGAVVVLEGPVEFSVQSSALGSLTRGKLLARVDHQATGFAVESPIARVTDFGTEFGIAVADNGSTVTHVTEGDVLFESLAGTLAPEKLSAGDICYLAVGGNSFVRKTIASSNLFRRARRFADKEPADDPFDLQVNFRPPENVSIAPLGWNHIKILQGNAGRLAKPNGARSDIQLEIVDGFGWLYPTALVVQEPHQSEGGIVFPLEVLRDLAGDNYHFANRNGIAVLRLSSPRAYDLAITIVVASDRLQDRTVCNIDGMWSPGNLEFVGGESVELLPDADGDSASLRATSRWDEVAGSFILELKIANGVEHGSGAAGVSALHIRAIPLEPTEVPRS